MMEQKFIGKTFPDEFFSFYAPNNNLIIFVLIKRKEHVQ